VERYYLRVLLKHVASTTSFNNLRTIFGIILPTFCEAIERRGLIEVDNMVGEGHPETTEWMMLYALQRFLARILEFCERSDVFKL
jgi:hypothetical protein